MSLMRQWGWHLDPRADFWECSGLISPEFFLHFLQFFTKPGLADDFGAGYLGGLIGAGWNGAPQASACNTCSTSESFFSHTQFHSVFTNSRKPLDCADV